MEEKYRKHRTAEQVKILLDMLTQGVSARVLMRELKYKPMPFDTKGLISFQFHHTQMDGIPAAEFLERLQQGIHHI